VGTSATAVKTAIAMHDPFISYCDIKYMHNYVQPETFINHYIDKVWGLLIQTFPFPEYLSGHSGAYSSAATVLTQMVGDNYKFVDSAEVPFGRPARTYKSFYEASDAASISRLYGGIHFMPSIENGKDQGRKIVKFILSKLD
jgi:hypothetical protein